MEKGKREMIKLIACDIDGTLINDGTKDYLEEALSPEVIQMVKDLKKAGYIFCVASGRQYPGVKNLFGDASDDIVFVSENGAYVIRNEKLISRTLLNRETAREIVEDILKTPGAQPMISGAQVCYLINPTEDFYKIVTEHLKNAAVKVNSFDDIKEEIQKIAICKTDGVRDIVERFTAKWGEVLNVAVAGDIWLDFTVSDKGKGIEAVARELGLKKEEIASFGDNFNDVSMFNASGMPFVMQNADERVKAYAKNICVSVPQTCKELFLENR